MRRIMIEKEKCNGCLSCTIACMVEHNPYAKSIHELDLMNRENEGRHYITLDYKKRPTPIFCRHCDEPECVIACMSGAMAKDDITGLVSYDPQQCASCFMCVMSCPYGVLKPDSAKGEYVVKCDFCGDRSTPACVENCPNNALHVMEVESR